MPTPLASGTLVADGTEQTLAADTSNKNYVLKVDLSAMVNGEVVELKIYDKVLAGGVEGLGYSASFANTQAEPIKYSIPVPADVSFRATLKQTVYVSAYKSFPWKLLSL